MHDYVIVGAGSAGCVLANLLSADPGCRVLLLEAGGEELPPAERMPAAWSTMLNTEVDWSYHTVPQAGAMRRRLFWPRGKMLGGSGSINCMTYIRGLPSDFDHWCSLGNSGWGWQEVLPFFVKSEHNERFKNDPLHGQGGPITVSDPFYVDPTDQLYLKAALASGFPHNSDFNGTTQEGVGLFQQTIKDGARSSSFSAYLKPVMSRPNLTIVNRAMCTRIVVKNGRATGIEYLHFGKPVTVHASTEVILSAGAINTPHLMLMSGIGPAEELRKLGVHLVHDLPGVGKNLQDHLAIGVTFDATEEIGLAGMSQEEVGKAIQDWQTHHRGPMSSNGSTSGGHIRSDASVSEPDLQVYFLATGDRDHCRYLSTGSGITFLINLQRPKSQGEIRLHSADPLSPPVIDPQYLTDSEGTDLSTLVKGVRLNRQIAATEPLTSLLTGEIALSADCKTDAEIGAYIRRHCQTLYHPCGTCSMGTHSLAVVDPELKVRGLAGLRVADASVFPRIISGNLNATTVMVAERAAAMVLSDHSPILTKS